MATYHGKEGSVYKDEAKVAEVTDWTYDIDTRAQEDTQLGDTGASETAGIPMGSGRISCHWYPGDSTGQKLLRAGSTINLTLYPTGTTNGNVKFAGSVLIKRMSLSGGTQGMTKVEFEYGGVLTESVIST